MRRAAASVAAAGAGAWAVARALRSRRATSFTGRVALVTGGSRGLGLLLARRLADEGARVAVLARTEADLDAALADLRPRTEAPALGVACDVRDRAAVEAAVQRVVETLGAPSLVVHNAGVIGVGPEAHLTEADYREAMDTHFWGALYLTEAVRPHLPRDGSARVGYVSSIGGRVAVPHLAAYSASKHALVGYADAMRTALARDRIAVTTITPGLMRTGSHPNAVVKGDHEAEYAWFAAADASPLLSMDGGRAADRILDALRHGDPALTLTLPAKIAAALDGAAPGWSGRLLRAAAALLPDPAGPRGDVRRSGWDSFSAWAPSLLTRKADAEVAPNNELRGHPPPA